MTLVVHTHTVTSARLGAETGIDAGRLTIDASALAVAVRAADERLADVRVQLVEPGTATRIVCVKDVIQPRLKASAGEAEAAVGTGILTVVDNFAVATCGPIVGYQEGIIDMSGPGAAYSPFSELPLLVLELEPAAGSTAHEHEAAVRVAGLAAAEYIARACAAAAPDRVEEIIWQADAEASDRPRIAYVYMALSQGLLHDTYVWGRSASRGLPLLIDPRAVLEGAVVSGNCVSACDKNTTFHHQNNPIVAELLAGHGKNWIFAGAVLTNAPTRLAEKQRSAEAAVELVRQLHADGAIVSKEGFGNPDADLMMIVRRLEQAGIKTVAITDEFAGPDGGSQSLADTAPEADAVVSVGNANERIALPAMQTVIGPLPDATRLAGGYAQSLHDDGTMEVELQAIVGATNQLGFGRLSCREV